MTDFRDLSTNREFGGIVVTTLTVAATIKPASVFIKLVGTAASIINIIPPIDGFHELNFLMGNDLILFDSGGNIVLPVAGTMTAGMNTVVKLTFNPLNRRYYASAMLAS